MLAFNHSMNTTLESIACEALELPPDQRVTLAHRLLTSVDLAPEIGAAEAWQQEIERRIRNYDQGLSKTIPAAEAFARLAKIAPRR
jgi:putative addiction module component (TIGR02574 family)